MRSFKHHHSQFHHCSIMHNMLFAKWQVWRNLGQCKGENQGPSYKPSTCEEKKFVLLYPNIFNFCWGCVEQLGNHQSLWLFLTFFPSSAALENYWETFFSSTFSKCHFISFFFFATYLGYFFFLIQRFLVGTGTQFSLILNIP